LLLATLAFSCQIYYDFNGYSLIAIGVSRLFGFQLPDNSNFPYAATSLSDFWHRWHISLSSWLRDYLYIPLGGNRRGLPIQIRNLLITMLLGGLWHGAHWTFVLWGALHGTALAIERLGATLLTAKRLSIHAFVSRSGSWALTQLFVLFCWIFFRASTFADAQDVISGIIQWRGRVPSPEHRSRSCSLCYQFFAIHFYCRTHAS